MATYWYLERRADLAKSKLPPPPTISAQLSISAKGHGHGGGHVVTNPLANIKPGGPSSPYGNPPTPSPDAISPARGGKPTQEWN